MSGKSSMHERRLSNNGPGRQATTRVRELQNESRTRTAELVGQVQELCRSIKLLYQKVDEFHASAEILSEKAKCHSAGSVSHRGSLGGAC
jgi:uncharacterized coiled-coil DUF342 family protein